MGEKRSRKNKCCLYYSIQVQVSKHGRFKQQKLEPQVYSLCSKLHVGFLKHVNISSSV